MIHSLVLGIVFVSGIAAAVQAVAAPDVAVEGGRVRGTVEDGLAVYKGVPFAAPPVGELRWKAPQRVVPWEGVRAADHFQAACPQPAAGNAGPVGNGVGKMSEDCLYLNVWAPEDTKGGKLAVMVWIHGGGFASGSPAMRPYAGENIAKEGVVFVSIAYRLGALGFLAHPELTAENGNGVSGNYGLLDQIAALKWVQKNIAAFGGDPDNVTIFGESAGSFSVSILCASPLAKGLFKRAIGESGAAFAPADSSLRDGARARSLRTAEREGIAFANRMKAGSVAELRKMPAEAFLKDSKAGMGGFWPNNDGYVIAGDPREIYRQGKYNDVDVMIGSNSNEGAMFVNVPILPAFYAASMQKAFGPLADDALKLYPGTDGNAAMQSTRDIFRDMAFAWPAYTWATLQTGTGKANVYVYYFGQSQPERRDGVKITGASHGDEINYVFGHVKRNFNYLYTEKDRQLSRIMMDYWVSFARTGKPVAKGMPDWPKFRDGQDTVMYFTNYAASLGPVMNRPQIDLMTKFFDSKKGKTDE